MCPQPLDQSIESMTRTLISVLDRRRTLRAVGGHFDERARLQSEIHTLRATLAERRCAARSRLGDGVILR